MSESTHPFPSMTSSRKDAHLFPEISSYIDESTHLSPEISSYMNEAAHLFPGMDSRLYIAAEEGNVDALKDLIAAEEENVYAPNGGIGGRVKLNIFQQFTGLGNSVLHIAISSGNLRFIEKLLEDVNKDLGAGRGFLRAKNSDGNTALHLAAFYGHHKLVEKFLKLMERDLEAGGEFLRSENSQGNTALHETIKGQNCKVVDILLNHDASLSSVSNLEGEKKIS